VAIRDLFSWLSRGGAVGRLTDDGARARVEHVQVTNPWHAVGINTGVLCCRASVFLRETRFLSRQAPPLPLQGCTQPKTCRCRYKHYSDRRTGPRRASESELFQDALSRHTQANLTNERRARRGRRATDGH
jgi:hypothetical protein